ncbi:MAG: hypothetical protein AB9872_17210 [Solidesulfovibrio sp.]
MNEATLRRYHRGLGLILAILLGLQALTGLFLSLNDLLPPAMQSEIVDKSFGFLHRGGRVTGNIYRVLLGAAVLYQITLGGLISLKIRARTKRP